eukprot:6149274-Karenia_brevis.AAC.1
MDKKGRSLVKDAQVFKAFDLNSDHRAVRLELDIKDFKLKCIRRGKSSTTLKGWEAASVTEYHAELNSRIAALKKEIALE